MADASSMLLVCRPEFAETLAEECSDRIAAPVERIGPNAVLVRPGGRMLPECIFERQRLVNPSFILTDHLKPLARECICEILGPAAIGKPLWTFHPFSEEEEVTTQPSLAHRLEGIQNTLIREGRKIAPDLEKRFRPPHRLKPGGWVIQLLLTPDGLWHTRELMESMLNPRPGGFSRMKWDPRAPSRSYLKMEEALERMPDPPAAGERVIDLGAAPGGWTHAFIKRGCDVIAVDHGPMKLPPREDGWGTAWHVRENGITYQGPADWPMVDWLVGDMLIAPGVALGLLSRWIDSARARRIICNIKLPQVHPYEAIRPVEAMLKRQATYHWRIKQLYHDRREITVMANR